MKVAWVIGISLLLLVAPCRAGDLEDGVRLYEHGHYARAASKFRIAAEHGDAEALRRLGFLYYHGQGVRQDNPEAVMLFARSANAGDVQSASNLAKMYEFGMGVAQDDARATEWYRRAAEMGDPVSQFGASIMYYKGQGVPRDRVEAVKWWTLAMMHGAEWAAWTEQVRLTVASAQAKLTAAEVAEGTQRAELWSKAHPERN